METIYTVIVTENYQENQGNPINTETETFDNLHDAEQFFAEQEKETISDNGVCVYIELFSGDEENPLENFIKSGGKTSAEIPQGAVIVLYRHRTYMNYCYEVVRIENAKDSQFRTYEDLPYSEDHVGSLWADVHDNIEEFTEAYEKGYGIFAKLQKGTQITEDFLAANGVEEYQNEETEN